MKYLSTILLSLLFYCTLSATEKIILLNEGTWQGDNGRITYFEDGKVVSNQWFRDVNGHKLGDTPNDIIQIKPNLIAISVNMSNIIQFIDASGHELGVNDVIPNNRKLATDGEYLYASTYGHQCVVNGEKVTFTKGYVAKIDVTTFKVIAAVEVGYEPEGISHYNGKLFVANSGGYAFQEDHDYEKTVSVIDAGTMALERNVDTGHINLYGQMSRSGRYLCINSSGDYYSVAPSTIILDCQAVIDGKPDRECFVSLPYPATYNCTAYNGSFYVVGSAYSTITNRYEFNYLTIDPVKLSQTAGREGVYETMPGTIIDDLKKMTAPYSIYVNPYTGYIYATDAANYTEGGYLYQWSPEGKLLGSHQVYINPGHFLALNPDGETGIDDVTSDVDGADAPVEYFNLQGQRVANPGNGLYIKRQGSKATKVILH